MRVRRSQNSQKERHDFHAKERDLAPGKEIYAKNFGNGPRWLPGILQEAKGPVSFTAELEDGRIIRRHSDHLRIRTDVPIENRPVSREDLPMVADQEDEESEPLAVDSPDEPITPEPEPEPEPKLRRSTRVRRPPDRYDPRVN